MTGNDGLWIAAALVGFWAIPTIAQLSPRVVNGFLILVLFSSLLLNRDRWLPYLSRLELSTKSGGMGGGGGNKKRV